MEQIQHFTPRARATQYPYDEWFDGGKYKLTRKDLRGADPKVVANAALSYARRNDFAAVALVSSTRDGRVMASTLEIWGDRERSWADGPPPEMALELRLAGYRPGQRKPSPRAH